MIRMMRIQGSRAPYLLGHDSLCVRACACACVCVFVCVCVFAGHFYSLTERLSAANLTPRAVRLSILVNFIQRVPLESLFGQTPRVTLPRGFSDFDCFVWVRASGGRFRN